jgi:predicted dienelactone hydrolase
MLVTISEITVQQVVATACHSFCGWQVLRLEGRENNILRYIDRCAKRMSSLVFFALQGPPQGRSCCSCLKLRKTESLQLESAANIAIRTAVVEDRKSATGISPQHMETLKNS